MRFAAFIEVSLRAGIADPEGATIEGALPTLGYSDVSAVRVGRSVRLVIDAPDAAAARARVDALCQELLANPVLEEATATLEATGMSARVAVVVFPGTNCEYDVLSALSVLGGAPELVWHSQRSLEGFDAVVLPGGFAHGDYLRPGALARFSPVMEAVRSMASEGAPVVGICNGFQVLCEAGLLPGALQKNRGLRFVCTTVEVRVEQAQSALTGRAKAGEILRLPVNHFSGSYIAHQSTLAQLRDEGNVILRYVQNPNGSTDDIAGITNGAGNVVGLMPHPERASDSLLGSDDGVVLLASLLAAAAQ